MDGRTARAVERAVHGANRLTQLVETLFDLSRISTGRLTLARRELDLGDMLRDRLGLLKEEAVRAGCEVTLHARPGVRGYWDQVRLEQVITSLFENAIKYGAGAPVSISLELGADGREAILEIGDRGAGIAPEDLGRIFDRYARAVSSYHFGGLGLGLYVSRTLVEAHGGSIEASNRAEGGACFTVRLPLWRGPEAPSAGRSDAIS